MASKPDSPFILVDGSSYLFRAFHALPELINAQGQQTGAIYGVLNMLRKLVDTYQPKYMAVVFDAKGKTFRDDLYPQYKAHRPPMPDELSSQVPPLLELVSASGLPMLQVPGVEADDVIGTLAGQATEAGWKTVISTGDKDLAQLVNEQVSLINTMNDSVMDDQGVAEKFGVEPGQIIDFLSLVGDSADNIPGIPKVGPKTAAKWLSQYGSLDELVAHAGDVKGKVGENLRAHLDQLPLSKELATIRCDLELGVDLYDLSVKPPELDTLRSWFERLQFKTWLRQLNNETGGVAEQHQAAVVDVEYQTLLSRQEFVDWLQRLQQSELFGFDTETTSLDYMQAQIVGLSFSIKPAQAAYLPLAHDYPGAPEQLDRDWVFDQLRSLLEDPRKAKLGHNLKYDRNVLANHDIRLQGIAYDSMLESYVLDSTASRHDLDSLLSLIHISEPTRL